MENPFQLDHLHQEEENLSPFLGQEMTEMENEWQHSEPELLFESPFLYDFQEETVLPVDEELEMREPEWEYEDEMEEEELEEEDEWEEEMEDFAEESSEWETAEFENQEEETWEFEDLKEDYDHEESENEEENWQMESINENDDHPLAEVIESEEEAEEGNPAFEGYLEEEASDMVWRMRPPIRFQGSQNTCWAAALSSWSMVTKGVKKFKTKEDAIAYFKNIPGALSAQDSLTIPVGGNALKQQLGLQSQLLKGPDLTVAKIGPMLKQSHLLVFFKNQAMGMSHAVVVYGIDHNNICYMDPAVDPNSSGLDKVKKNRICQPLSGSSTTEYVVLWKGKPIVSKELEQLSAFESNYGAEATKEKVKWYQTILQVAAGYPQVPINGNHNDPITREVLLDFQNQYSLKKTGYLEVDSNLALTQMAIEYVNKQPIPNTHGKRSNLLMGAIKKFQQQNGLMTDGKVGQNTRDKMIEALKIFQSNRLGKWAQTVLYSTGFYQIKINGNFKDSNTQNALAEFQRKFSLNIDPMLQSDTLAGFFQFSLEKILNKKINNKIGEWSKTLIYFTRPPEVKNQAAASF